MAMEDGREITVSGDNGSEPECPDCHADSAAVQSSAYALGEYLPMLRAQGLVTLKDGSVELTEDGTSRAEHLIRRHRLAELLFSEILDFDVDSNQPDVCRLEHAISPRVVERICGFLGHPPYCPHGRPIPRGECCGTITREVPPLVTPLSQGRIGEDYRIVFITPRSHSRLDRLTILGIAPGATIRLHQKKPSYVLKIGETDVALDADIIKEIFVRPA